MRKLCQYALILLGIVMGIAALGWFFGMFPPTPWESKSGLKHALNLERLPSSIEINSVGITAFTDYGFHADITMDPAELDKVLAGREYENVRERFSELLETGTVKPSSIQLKLDSHASGAFPVGDVWEWSEPHPVEGRLPSICRVVVSDDRRRVLVTYLSE